jgi:hypothetical protein
MRKGDVAARRGGRHQPASEPHIPPQIPSGNVISAAPAQRCNNQRRVAEGGPDDMSRLRIDPRVPRPRSKTPVLADARHQPQRPGRSFRHPLSVLPADPAQHFLSARR